MGYDLIGAVLFAALTPLVVLGFVAFWMMTNRERSDLERAWETWAAARGRELVPARGEWPNRTSPAVRWTADDVSFVLTVVGAEARARTRLVARPRGRLLGSFRVRAGVAGAGESKVGDAYFAQAFALRERPAGLAARVLDDESQKALLRFRQRDDISLSYHRGRITLEWPGRESSDARIAEAEHVVAALVRRVDEVFSRGATPKAA